MMETLRHNPKSAATFGFIREINYYFFLNFRTSNKENILGALFVPYLTWRTMQKNVKSSGLAWGHGDRGEHIVCPASGQS